MKVLIKTGAKQRFLQAHCPHLENTILTPETDQSKNKRRSNSVWSVNVISGVIRGDCVPPRLPPPEGQGLIPSRAGSHLNTCCFLSFISALSRKWLRVMRFGRNLFFGKYQDVLGCILVQRVRYVREQLVCSFLFQEIVVNNTFLGIHSPFLVGQAKNQQSQQGLKLT